MRIHILRRGREGGPRGARVCGIACGGEIKRMRSVSLSLSPSSSGFLSSSICSIFSPSLFFSSSSSSSSSRLLLSLLGRARELWQTRYQFLTFARKRAFSLFLHPSLLLDDNVEAPVLARWSRPLPSALSFCPPRRSRPGRRRRRDSIIIADSLISINCRARGFSHEFREIKMQTPFKTDVAPEEFDCTSESLNFGNDPTPKALALSELKSLLIKFNYDFEKVLIML